MTSHSSNKKPGSRHLPSVYFSVQFQCTYWAVAEFSLDTHRNSISESSALHLRAASPACGLTDATHSQSYWSQHLIPLHSAFHPGASWPPKWFYSSLNRNTAGKDLLFGQHLGSKSRIWVKVCVIISAWVSCSVRCWEMVLGCWGRPSSYEYMVGMEGEH